MLDAIVTCLVFGAALAHDDALNPKEASTWVLLRALITPNLSFLRTYIVLIASQMCVFSLRYIVNQN